MSLKLDEYGREIGTFTVISKGKSFTLGKCQCGYCDEDIAVAPGRYGDLTRFKVGHNYKGINNPRFRGWKLVHKGTRMMLYMPWHPNSDKKGYVYRYVWVMSRFLKRSLSKKEVVHHIDENSLNDDINNLMLFPSQKEHRAFHRGDYTKKHCSNPSCTRPNETFVNKKGGYQSWYKTKDGKDLCVRCYRKMKYWKKKNKN